MDSRIKATSLALAIAAAFALPATSASAHRDRDRDRQQTQNGITLGTNVSIQKDLKFDGTVKVDGTVPVASDTEALIQDSQASSGNTVDNDYHQNNASISGSVLNGASGNIGVNTAAGDNNVQSNEAALAASDAGTVFGFLPAARGAATAQVFMGQAAHGNDTYNTPAANNAALSGSVLNGASGNIGVNIAAGDSNVQKNALSGATADSNLAIASISNAQDAGGNTTHNNGQVTSWNAATKTFGIDVTGSMSADGSYSMTNSASKSGSGSHSYSSVNATDTTNAVTVSATASGLLGANSTSSASTDGVSATASAPNLLLIVPVLSSSASASNDALNTVAKVKGSNWSYAKKSKSSASGSFQAASNFEMAKTVTMTVPVPATIAWSVDNASISGSVLNGASGNIGVNIASGTNNLQANILAVSAALH